MRCAYLRRRLWLPNYVGDACRGDGLDDVGEDEAVGELRLEVPDPLAPLELVQVVVRPVRVDLDDGLVLLLNRGRHPDGFCNLPPLDYLVGSFSFRTGEG